MNKKRVPIGERVYPPDCSCVHLAFGTVEHYDPEKGVKLVHKIATRAIRKRDCAVHGAANERCTGRYLPRMLAR
jgi:hypothetical protein